MRPIIIIHGWSDDSTSFITLAEKIRQKTNRNVSSIFLGNYVSLDDDIELKDLSNGLSRAWTKQKLSIEPHSVDIIIHSTGGLIVRLWTLNEFILKGRKPAINNLVMLAPANFGSPLAHKGRSFWGRVIKGFNSKKRFETGEKILYALEIASQYTWDLARFDLLGKENIYHANGIKATVIVGNSGYKGISSMANTSGSDGTVYVSTANLNCAYLDLDFMTEVKNPKINQEKLSSKTSFLIKDEHNHSTITLKNRDISDDDNLLKSIIKALEIKNELEFADWIVECEKETKKVIDIYAKEKDDYKHSYQNTVFHVKDDQGFDVTDYVVEFYENINLGDNDIFSEFFHTEAITKIHSFSKNSAYRSFLVNCTKLHSRINEKKESLRISLSAMPNFHDEKNVVGYKTFENDDIGFIELNPEQLRKYFVPNRTLLIEITIKRDFKDSLFTIKPMPQ